MSNMTQLFDASRFPGNVKVRSAGKSAVMTLSGPENGSLRLFSLWDGAVLSFNRIYTDVYKRQALSRGEVQVIGATTFKEYRQHIEKDSALERRFQPVTITEPLSLIHI